mmetsp:Transcript_10838/g.24556  ORF Transcript_10838/g.24556 Transcript_10838/m.24556 type:complete len:677 (-) Transcript_10838:59-2089(-)
MHAMEPLDSFVDEAERRALLRKLVSCRAMKDVRPYVRREEVLYATDYELEHPEEVGSVLDLSVYFHRLDLAHKFLTFAGRVAAQKLVKISTRALAWAARDGREALLRQLLDLQGDVSQKDWHGHSALHAAVLRGHATTVRALLASGAWQEEVNKEVVEQWAHHWHLLPTFQGCGVALSRVPRRCSGASSRRLGKETGPMASRVASSKVHLANVTRLQSLLLKAIEAEELAEIEGLVQQGAPLLAKYSSQRTAGRGLELPSPTMKDKDTAVDLVNPVDWAALALKFRAAVKLLEVGDGKVEFGRDQQGSYFVRHSLAKQTRRALTVAAFRNATQLLAMLLARNADVKQTNAYGESALKLATRQGHEKAVAMLLKHGAWDAEERKQELLQLARSRGVASILEEAGVSATAAKEVEIVPPSVPPSDTLIDELRSIGDDGDRAFKVDRFLELAGQVVQPPGVAPQELASPSRARRLLRPASAPSHARVSDTPMEIVMTKMELRRESSALAADLHHAIRKGDLARIQALELRGASFQGQFDIGQGVLGNCVDLACTVGQPQVAMALLSIAQQRGLELAANAKAAFFWAVLQGSSDVLQVLLDGKASPGQRLHASSDTEPGSTALELAILAWRAKEVDMLLGAGAWEHETEERQVELLACVSMRKPIQAVFLARGLDTGGGP